MEVQYDCPFCTLERGTLQHIDHLPLLKQLQESAEAVRSGEKGKTLAEIHRSALEAAAREVCEADDALLEATTRPTFRDAFDRRIAAIEALREALG